MKLLAIIEVDAANDAEAQEKLDSFRASVADELTDRGISIYRPTNDDRETAVWSRSGWLRVPEGTQS